MSEEKSKMSEEITNTMIDDKKPCKNCGNNEFTVEKVVTRISGATMTAIKSRKCTNCNMD